MRDELSMMVNRKALRGNDTFAVFDQTRGEESGRAAQCSTEQLDEAMMAAEPAARLWILGDDEHDCHRMLAQAAAIVAGLATILASEQGRPLGDARADVARSARWLPYFGDVDASAISGAQPCVTP